MSYFFHILDLIFLGCMQYAEPVSKHIEEQGLEFLQFAFRWFNCLLIREVCPVTLDDLIIYFMYT